jgi:hypothetical protein
MGRARSTNGGVVECLPNIGGKARRKESTTKTNTYVVNIIKMNLREIRWVI